MLLLVIVGGMLSQKSTPYRRWLCLFSVSKRDLISSVFNTPSRSIDALFVFEESSGVRLGFTTVYDEVTIWSNVIGK